MPLYEGQEHQPSVALNKLKPPSEVLVIRFTGEIFEDYEYVVDDHHACEIIPTHF